MGSPRFCFFKDDLHRPVKCFCFILLSHKEEQMWVSWAEVNEPRACYTKWSKLECVNVAQSCPTLCNPMDYTVHKIFQARIVEWVAFPFSRASSQPRDWTQVSCITGIFFTRWATREAQEYYRCCSTRALLLSRGHSAMSGDVLGYHTWRWEGSLLSIWHSTPSPTTKNYLPQIFNTAEAEKPWARQKTFRTGVIL